MGSDKSHFNVSFINCEGQSHKTVATDHNSWRERRAEAESIRGPSAYQPNALPLGQTGSYKMDLVKESLILCGICNVDVGWIYRVFIYHCIYTPVFVFVVVMLFYDWCDVCWVYVAPQHIPGAIILTLCNTTVLHCKGLLTGGAFKCSFSAHDRV